MLIVSPRTAHAITPHASSQSWVIFIQSAPPGGGSGRIWIEGVDGAAIGQRLGELSRLNAYDTMIVGLIETTEPVSLEERLHAHFADALVHDNWYEATPELITLIQQTGQQAIQDLLSRTHPGALSTAPIDIKEMARIIGVSVPTIRRMVDRREIPCLRLGRVMRFVPGDVIAALQQR